MLVERAGMLLLYGLMLRAQDRRYVAVGTPEVSESCHRLHASERFPASEDTVIEAGP